MDRRLHPVLPAACFGLGRGDPVTVDLEADRDRITTTQAEAGSRQNRVQAAIQAAADNELRLSTSLSEVENADLPRTIVDLQMQEVAYQAALGATARVMQPSLLDFLR